MREPSARLSAEAVAATDAAARKRAAAPSWSDLKAAFGEQGMVYDGKGRPKGYRYPKTGDPEKDAKTAAKAYEMWNPQRRVAERLGAEVNAKVKSVRLRDPKTGRVGFVPEAAAEKKARKAGLVEAPLRKPNLIYRAGKWWRYAGNGHWAEEGTVA